MILAARLSRMAKIKAMSVTAIMLVSCQLPAESSAIQGNRRPFRVRQTWLDPSAEDAVLEDHDSNIPLIVDAIQETAPRNRSSQRDLLNLEQNHGMGDELPNGDADDEFTNQLSWRFGRLQLTQDGQLQYFGSTSNLTLLDALVGVNFSSLNNTQKDTREILENANLDIDVDEVLEQHLLELYFAWQNPPLYLVDYNLFWEARQQNRHDGIVSSYYSRSLVDAMWVSRIA